MTRLADNKRTCKKDECIFFVSVLDNSNMRCRRLPSIPQLQNRKRFKTRRRKFINTITRNPLRHIDALGRISSRLQSTCLGNICSNTEMLPRHGFVTSKHSIDAIIRWPQRSESIRSRLRAGSGVTNCGEGERRLSVFVFYERVGERIRQDQARWTIRNANSQRKSSGEVGITKAVIPLFLTSTVARDRNELVFFC